MKIYSNSKNCLAGGSVSSKHVTLELESILQHLSVFHVELHEVHGSSGKNDDAK